MSYEQTLWIEIKDVVNSKILSKQNRLKKWEYGYNADYDFIVISKTGKIGQVIEIQNLRIALPAANKSYKRSKVKSEQKWEKFEADGVGSADVVREVDGLFLPSYQKN